MEDINVNTRDEYGLKAGGILCVLDKFETYFSLRFGFLPFSCAESTSKVLQAKDICIQEAVSTTQAFYRRQRQDDAFDKFFEGVVNDSQGYRRTHLRRPPIKFGGSNQHEFGNPLAYYRKQYFEVLDLLIQELSDRFQQKDVMQPVLAIEALLMKSANGENQTES